MSGPKCGTASVSDARRLEAERRQREEEETSELRALERKERLEEKERHRRDRLREKEQERRRREVERQRREQERAEQARQHELATYHRIRGQMEAALTSRKELQERFPNIALPPAPAIPDPDTTDAASIRHAIEQVAQLAQAYQRQVDEALMRFHQATAIANASESMRIWSMQFRARATRIASDVIAALEPESLFAASQGRKIRLAAVAEKARSLVACVSDEEHELSDQILDALDEVFSIEDESAAQVALEHLRQAIVADQEQRARAKSEAEGRRRAEEELRRREQTRGIAAEIADTLEDLGYTVSGVEATAFARDGHLYAARGEWPDHVLRFEFDPLGGQIRSAPLRIADEASPAVIGAADAAQMRREDAAFDMEWCSPSGIAKLRELMARRGVNLAFSADHRPGDLATEVVTEQALGENIQRARTETIHAKHLKTRNRK